MSQSGPLLSISLLSCGSGRILPPDNAVPVLGWQSAIPTSRF
jgi:hypothetical protein